MYTNIDNNLGQEAIHYWLEKYPDIKTRTVSNDFILKSLKIILEHNTFNFDNQKYIQIQGTAMGTKCAPIYATLVIAFLETRPYEKFEDKFGVTNKTRLEKEWLRYLDDCCIYWDVNICNENELHNMLNDLHPNIKFTMEANSSRMNFLDIQLLVAQDKIITDIYFKQCFHKANTKFPISRPRNS